MDEIRRFVARTLREFLNEEHEKQAARNYVTTSYEAFMESKGAETRDETLLRMANSFDLIEVIWGDETMAKLTEIAVQIQTQIVINGGNKIGRTCLAKEARLSNYNSDENEAHNFSDLEIVYEGSQELIVELESFFIDFFLVVRKSNLLNSNGIKKGPEECSESDLHYLYVTIPS